MIGKIFGVDSRTRYSYCIAVLNKKVIRIDFVRKEVNGEISVMSSTTESSDNFESVFKSAVRDFLLNGDGACNTLKAFFDYVGRDSKYYKIGEEIVQHHIDIMKSIIE